MKEKYLVMWSLFALLFIGTFSVSLSYLGTRVVSSSANATMFHTGKLDLNVVDSKLENVMLVPIYDKDYHEKKNKKSFSIISSKESLNSCTDIYLKINDISDELKNEYLKYRLISNNKIYEGNFKDAESEGNLLLADHVFIEKDTTNKFELYIWISYADGVDQMSMLNKNLTSKIVVKSYDSENINTCE